MPARNSNRDDPQTGIVTRTKPKTKKPSLYKVLLLNDDYTPMEFVVHVLERFFGKDHEEATRIMLHVHQQGVGVCGVYTYEVAETKVTQVMELARQSPASAAVHHGKRQECDSADIFTQSRTDPAPGAGAGQ